MFGVIRRIMFFLLVNFSFGQTNYYVDNNLGNDNLLNGNAPGASAWKTIEYAISNVTNPTTDQIIINISNDIYNLSNNQIDINRNFIDLTLLGEGSDNTFIQSSSDISLSSSRVIRVYSGNNVLLKKLTVRYGRIIAPNVNGGGVLNSGGTLLVDYCKVTENYGGSVGYGGGISNIGGNLTIKNSTFSYNIVDDSCYGAGIGSLNGTLNVYNSTISFNSALSTGGIAVISNNADAIFNIENSTIFGNTASYRFGGIRISIFGSGIENNIFTNINCCTIFNNSAIDLYGGIGISSSTNFNIKNSIVSGNTSNGNPDDIRGTIVIPISMTSGGYNIFKSVNDVIIGGEQNNGIGIDPGLLPLADNNSNYGTQTCAILDNSPARDQIPALTPNGAPLMDQRGYQRNGDYDIGAYEFSSTSDLSNELSTPNIFYLNQNYPNPFNPSTKISWQSPVGSWQTIKVYDVLGNEVATLVDEYRSAGNYEFEFNLAYTIKDPASGVYFYQLRAGDFLETKKMILIK